MNLYVVAQLHIIFCSMYPVLEECILKMQDTDLKKRPSKPRLLGDYLWLMASYLVIDKNDQFSSYDTFYKQWVVFLLLLTALCLKFDLRRYWERGILLGLLTSQSHSPSAAGCKAGMLS